MSTTGQTVFLVSVELPEAPQEAKVELGEVAGG